jgi:zinc protease
VTGDGQPPEARRAERDGVPVLWAPGQGPCVGALLVRSGKADETLRIGGINHLVEHLALFPIGRPAYNYNGLVEDALTIFYAEGTPEEVAGFLRDVSASLADLPFDRLPLERRVLTTEASGRDMGLDARLLSLRFGPAGYGLLHHEELGIGWLGEDDLRRWAAERFTCANAVAWMTAEPPDTLELSLPAGEALRPPAPEPIPSLVLPAYLQQGTGGVALTVLAERSTALHVGFGIAAERAHERLRRDAGLSYSVNAGYTVLDGRLAHVVLQADCRDLDAARVRDELLAVVDDLAEHAPTEEELEADRRRFERITLEPDAVPGMLDNRARDVVMGVRETTTAELHRERTELTPDAVAAAMRAALETALLLVPAGTGALGGDRWTRYDPATTEALDGPQYVPNEQWQQFGEDSRLVVGPDGVTISTRDGGEPLSVRYADCVALVEHLSGRVTLVDRSGAWVDVSPRVYGDGDEAVATVREAVDPDLVVPLTVRERELAPVVREQLPEAALTRVPREVDALPVLLGDEEQVELLASAARGPQAGLLVLTDRRLVFAYVGHTDNDLLELAREEVRSARAKGLMRKKLVVQAADGEHEFAAILPGDRLGGFQSALA